MTTPPNESDLLARVRRRLGSLVRDKYRLDAVLGVGGMAAVYKATHRNQAEFALKMLHPELSLIEDVRARFLREGYAANSVKHPGVVHVVDDDVAEDGAAFLVMELLHGANAEELWKQHGGRLPVGVALAIADQLLEVLAAAHAKGIVHRDIKPANLFVTRDGVVKVLDFGIARVRDAMGGSAQATGTGAYLGTPAFMAPEQALSLTNEIDATTDVWAVGATLFLLLSGKTVHPGDAPSQILVKAATTPAPSLRSLSPDVPEPIAAVVDRALAFEKADRWPSATAMRGALLEASRASIGTPPPSKTALAALHPPDSHEAIDAIASAPTLASDSSAPELPGGGSSLPGSTQEAPPTVKDPPRGRRGAAWVVGAALLLCAGVGVAFARRHFRAPSHAAPAPVAPASVVSSPEAGIGRATAVLVLGIENQTTDPVFDGTLEAVLASALMRSLVIDPFAGGALRSLATELGVQGIDEGLGRKLAARGGRVVTVRGFVATKGAAYSISVTATDGATATPLLTVTLDADGPPRVVPTMGRLASAIRGALGDPVPSDPAFAEQTSMSASLEADHELVVGRGLLDAGKYDDAIPHLQRAVALDPEFAAARASLGLTLWNEVRRPEAAQEFKAAFKWVDRMGERERLQFLGDYYSTFGEYGRAVAAYEELLSKWPGDVRAAINLSVTYEQKSDAKQALELGRRVASEHPRHVIARSNFANFCLVAGDFDCASSEAERVIAEFAQVPGYTYDNLAVAYALAGRLPDAEGAYARYKEADPLMRAFQEADLAFYEGKLTGAASQLRKSLAEEASGRDRLEVEASSAMLAEILARRGDRAGAAVAADKATSSTEPRILFLGASVDLAIGREPKALGIASQFEKSLVEDERLYGKLLRAEALRVRGKAHDAVDLFEDALRSNDAWFGHFGLARAYLDMRAYPEAYGELRTCLQRRGEAANFWLPSLHFVPPVTYFLARAQEGMGNPEAKASYRAFLAMEPDAEGDPFADDARRRSAEK